MGLALREARKGLGKTSPNPAVGAVIVREGEVIARGYHRRAGLPHAEIEAFRALEEEKRARGATLYVTLEPCPMCAAAISAARLERLYYGAADPKSGGVAVGARVFSHPQCHHVPQVYDGIGAIEAEALLKAFFADRRA